MPAMRRRVPYPTGARREGMLPELWMPTMKKIETAIWICVLVSLIAGLFSRYAIVAVVSGLTAIAIAYVLYRTKEW